MRSLASANAAIAAETSSDAVLSFSLPLMPARTSAIAWFSYSDAVLVVAPSSLSQAVYASVKSIEYGIIAEDSCDWPTL